MIGRKKLTKILKEHLRREPSSFLAVTGRRRVGKTYLIDETYRKHFCFRMTGIQHGSFQQQLDNFSYALQEKTKVNHSSPPKNWQEGFQQLRDYLRTLSPKSKKVIFIDELPWIVTARSQFLQLFAHFWNDFISKEKNYVLIICGSATSWLIKKVINDTGGLHNRINETIYVKPFTIKETKLFLETKQVRLTSDGLAKIYMAIGGIPYYLEFLRKGDTPTTAINRLMFDKNAPLKNEFQNLYKALFENAENHEAVVKALASSRGGINRTEILKKSKIRDGGPYNRTMEDLISSGFAVEENPYGKKKRGTLYKLVDEYSIFYHKFIKDKNKQQDWQLISASQAYKIWSGYAFELLVFKHLNDLKSALGISAVRTQTSSFRKIGNKTTEGFQIDILIERADHVIHLCECKFYSKPFSINKSYAQKLRFRKYEFIETVGTTDQVLTTLICNIPPVDNAYFREEVDSVVLLDELL